MTPIAKTQIVLVKVANQSMVTKDAVSIHHHLHLRIYAGMRWYGPFQTPFRDLSFTSSQRFV